jgi:hypothetical protein
VAPRAVPIEEVMELPVLATVVGVGVIGAEAGSLRLLGPQTSGWEGSFRNR